jgi:hypothetical protein
VSVLDGGRTCRATLDMRFEVKAARQVEFVIEIRVEQSL